MSPSGLDFQPPFFLLPLGPTCLVSRISAHTTFFYHTMSYLNYYRDRGYPSILHSLSDSIVLARYMRIQRYSVETWPEIVTGYSRFLDPMFLSPTTSILSPNAGTIIEQPQFLSPPASAHHQLSISSKMASTHVNLCLSIHDSNLLISSASCQP